VLRELGGIQRLQQAGTEQSCAVQGMKRPAAAAVDRRLRAGDILPSILAEREIRAELKASADKTIDTADHPAALALRSSRGGVAMRRAAAGRPRSGGE